MSSRLSMLTFCLWAKISFKVDESYLDNKLLLQQMGIEIRKRILYSKKRRFEEQRPVWKSLAKVVSRAADDVTIANVCTLNVVVSIFS